MEQFSRTELLISSSKVEKLHSKHIAIFGCGGVGSQLINLARVGITHFDLFDNDVVSLSNINRQLIANHETVDKYKVDVMKKMILQINPNCEVNVYKEFILPENINTIDFKKYDYVIDAIDTITTKIALIENCNRTNTPIISCMGTGNKLNPSLLEITDIFKTYTCPLAKVIRHELRKRNITKLKVCYSKEEPLKVIADSSNGKHSPGSIVFVPAIAGLLIGNEVIKDLIKD